MTNPTIKLKSNDDVVYDVDVRVAERSQTIKTMLEDLGMDDCEDPVPLPNVSSAILKKVIEWATHHKDDPPSIDDDHSTEKRTDDISEWDTEFLKVDQGTLFELILAANYLDIKGLLDVTCKTVANMIKGKTPEEIRATFQLAKKKDGDGQKLKADNQKLMSDDQKPMADNQKLICDDQKPMADNQKPMADNQKLICDDQKSMANNQKLMSDDQKSEKEIVSDTDVVLEPIDKIV